MKPSHLLTQGADITSSSQNALKRIRYCLTQKKEGGYILCTFKVLLACLDSPYETFLSSQTAFRPTVSFSLFEGNVSRCTSPWTGFEKDPWITLSDRSQTIKSVMSGPH